MSGTMLTFGPPATGALPITGTRRGGRWKLAVPLRADGTVITVRFPKGKAFPDCAAEILEMRELALARLKEAFDGRRGEESRHG